MRFKIDSIEFKQSSVTKKIILNYLKHLKLSLIDH